MLKKAQVIMLPTNIAKSEYNQLWLCKNDILYNATAVKRIKSHEDTKFQELYIISDDEIKEGDWYLYLKYNTIIQKKDALPLKDNCKKIIATTDTSLSEQIFYYPDGKIIGDLENYKKLPQPSQQFIEKYIESYNKGEVIIDVLVEYENKFDGKKYVDEQDAYGYDKFKQVLKVNPKDNTITIRKLKENWNRKELEEIARKAFKAGVNKGIALEIYKRELDINHKADENFDKVPTENKWIEENL
jgi:hypothetical protein